VEGFVSIHKFGPVRTLKTNEELAVGTHGPCRRPVRSPSDKSWEVMEWTERDSRFSQRRAHCNTARRCRHPFEFSARSGRVPGAFSLGRKPVQPGPGEASCADELRLYRIPTRRTFRHPKRPKQKQQEQSQCGDALLGKNHEVFSMAPAHGCFRLSMSCLPLVCIAVFMICSVSRIKIPA